VSQNNETYCTDTLTRADTLAQASSVQEELLREFKDRAEILAFFVRSYQEFQDGTRVEPAYSGTAKSVGGDKQHTYNAAELDLRAAGIDQPAVKAHYSLIKEWIDTVVLAETDDAGGDEENVAKTDETLTLVEPPIHPGTTTFEDSQSDAERGTQPESETNRAAIEDFYEVPEHGKGIADSPQHDYTHAGLVHGEQPVSSMDRNRVDKPSSDLRRTDSMDTHRSQSSAWEGSDTEREDYPNIMIAKVLRSKYPPGAGDAPYLLPIRRAFSRLDWTSRGWLSKDTVENACIAAANLTGWTFDATAVAHVVMMEDSKDNAPDHRINPDEFYNIVLAMRGKVKEAIVTSSSQQGVKNSVHVLMKWYENSRSRDMLSSQWSRKEAFRIEGKDWGYASKIFKLPSRNVNEKEPKQRVYYYEHEIGGALQDFKIPLNMDLTTAIYLAVTYATSRVDAALRNWQSGIRRMPTAEKAEYVEALNNVLEINPAFHALEDNSRGGAYHSFDSCYDRARRTPIDRFDDLKDCPLQPLVNVRTDTWTVLKPVLGFVHDLGSVSLRKELAGGTPPPKLKRWRALRMLERSKDIIGSVNVLEALRQPIRNVEEWYRDHGASLVSRFDSCVEEANRLRTMQKSQQIRDSCGKMRVHVSLDKIPHIPFRKTILLAFGERTNLLRGVPWVFLQVYIDGSEEKFYTYDQHTAKPVWAFHL
jgi:hypothetical protein